MASVLVLGGAGFIGANICLHLAACGHRVTALDGLMPRTSGNASNLDAASGNLKFIAQRVEDVESLPDLLGGHDIVVDAMGWTSHQESFKHPEYDLGLNLGSHIAVTRGMLNGRPRLTVYLASAHQYGRVSPGPILETQPQLPLDIQAIHKTAAEHHYRLIAERHGLCVISLRFGNTIGPFQPLVGPDIGLIADMIRRSLMGETIVVFGEGRRRTVHYAPDVARMIETMARGEYQGFIAMNLPGEHALIADLAREVASCTGGTLSQRALPANVAAIDTGNAPLDCTLFKKHFGAPYLTPLAEALAATVAYSRDRLASVRSIQ